MNTVFDVGLFELRLPWTRVALELISPGQYGRQLADDIFKFIFVNEKFYILIEISLKCVPKGPIDNNIGLDTGLAPNRRHTIIWTNADPVHWCIYAALRGDKLKLI